MRRSIKLTALGITLGLFITLNIVWLAINPVVEASFTNPYYYISFFIILGSMAALIIYYVMNTRQKSKIRF